MPQQLIYTSAQRGIIAGRSGHCTVARSAPMREALMLQLEKLSYYQHLSLNGGQERQIYCCRVVDIRGSRFHVLSRIQDAGLDFTNRTNFLAHHLVFTPEEIRQFPSPPVILCGWSGWVKTWTQEPQTLDNEDWSGLANISGVVSVPATCWLQVTGDAVNGYGLLEARSGIAFRVDNLSGDQILALFAESLELLELRDPRRDFRATVWQYTFTTSMQEQDNPADFRWRCLHSDNPVSSRSSGPDCHPLSDVRAQRVTNEEKLFAQSGKQPPRFVIQPQNVRVREGEPAKFNATAEGVPFPNYQWYVLDQAGNGRVIADGTNAELVLPNPPFGVSRYVVRASNSLGEVTSEIAKLESERKLRISRPPEDEMKRVVPKSSLPSYVKSAEEIDRQRCRIEADDAQKRFQMKLLRNKILAITGLVFGLVIVAGLLWRSWVSKNHSSSAFDVKEVTNKFKNVDAEKPKTISVGEQANPNSSIKPNESEVAKASGAEAGPVLAVGFTAPPDPWKSTSIGSRPLKSCASFVENVFIINGVGEKVFGNSDDFFYLQQAASNSVSFSVRLLKADPQNKGRQGIMIRESEKPDAAFAFVGLSQESLFWIHRDISTTNCQTPILQARPKLPVFLKLVKRPDFVSGEFSADGTNWTTLGANQITLSDEHFLVGLAVCSGDINRPALAQFDFVRIEEENP